MEGSFEPNLISKHLTSFEDWGGRSKEVVTVVCSNGYYIPRARLMDAIYKCYVDKVTMGSLGVF